METVLRGWFAAADASRARSTPTTACPRV